MGQVVEFKQLRAFGLMVGGIFVCIGLWPMLRRGEDLRMWALVIGTLLVVPAAAFPSVLAPVYRAWMAVGHVLGVVNTRILLGVVYFVLITPMGLVMRAWGKDSMRRNFERNLDTYRVLRRPRPGSHVLHQF